MADKKVKLKDENITKVWIDAEGVITIISGGKEEQVDLQNLESKVRKIVHNNPDMVVSLKTDRMSKYKFMVEALDKLQASGAEKISLSTN